MFVCFVNNFQDNGSIILKLGGGGFLDLISNSSKNFVYDVILMSE